MFLVLPEFYGCINFHTVKKIIKIGSVILMSIIKQIFSLCNIQYRYGKSDVHINDTPLYNVNRS